MFLYKISTHFMSILTGFVRWWGYLLFKKFLFWKMLPKKLCLHRHKHRENIVCRNKFFIPPLQKHNNGRSLFHFLSKGQPSASNQSLRVRWLKLMGNRLRMENKYFAAAVSAEKSRTLFGSRNVLPHNIANFATQRNAFCAITVTNFAKKCAWKGVIRITFLGKWKNILFQV